MKEDVVYWLRSEVTEHGVAGLVFKDGPHVFVSKSHVGHGFKDPKHTFSMFTVEIYAKVGFVI